MTVIKYRFRLVVFLLVSHAFAAWAEEGQTLSSRNFDYHIRAEPLVSESENALLEKAYVWGWPMVYLHNVKKSLQLLQVPGISGGAPVAPINRLSMLTQPVGDGFVTVPCPNPDVVYGFGLLDLTEQPVVVQIPDAGSRYWMFQLGDHRTDSFAKIGSMYGTQPGFHLVVGPDWEGSIPEGISQVWRSPTNLAFVIPRYLAVEDLESLRETISKVAVYPLSRFNHKWKKQDWSKPKWYPAIGRSNRQQSKSVRPETFFKDLKEVLAHVPPLPGEECFYQELKSVLTEQDQDYQYFLSEKGLECEARLMEPLFDFHRMGKSSQTGWTSVSNGACFGTDYLSRAAVAKSNIFVNRPNEAKYFYLEVDDDGRWLVGRESYHLKFRPEALPAHQGFWSLTVYDGDHRLVGQTRAASSINSSSDTLKRLEDGSVEIMIQRARPTEPNTNWLPTPEGRFVLYLRVYTPDESVVRGHWTPPAAVNVWTPAVKLVSLSN